MYAQRGVSESEVAVALHKWVQSCSHFVSEFLATRKVPRMIVEPYDLYFAVAVLKPRRLQVLDLGGSLEFLSRRRWVVVLLLYCCRELLCGQWYALHHAMNRTVSTRDQNGLCWGVHHVKKHCGVDFLVKIPMMETERYQYAFAARSP